MVADREGRKFTLLKRKESPADFFSALAQPLAKFCDWHDNQHKSELSVAKKS